MRESELERKLVKKVESLGGLCIKLLSNHFIGLPDRLCLFPGGELVFIEVKSPTGRVRKIQKIVHSKLRKLGFKVIVLNSNQQIKEL